MKSADVHQVCPHGPDVLALELGELPADERAAVETHLAACAVCQAMLAGVRDVVGELRRVEDEPCRRDVAAGIMAHLDAEPPNASWPRRLLWGIPARYAAAAAAILAAVGLWWNFSGTRGGRPSESVVAVTSGGAAEAEALRHALDWLRSAQEPDGSWGAERWGAPANYEVGVSSLAMMALINEGTHAFAGPSGEALRRGVNRLVAAQHASGLIGPEFSGALYNQGLATLVLLEAGAVEDNPAWRAAADRAVKFICASQTRSGGWGYLRTAFEESSASASVWPLQALVRADSLGFEGVRPHIDRGLAWMKQSLNQDGLMGYRRSNDPPQARDALMAAGVVCLMMEQGGCSRPELQASLRALYRASGQAQEPVDFYRTYFIAKASVLTPPPDAERMLAASREQLRRRQCTSGPQAGSWDADEQWGPIGGRVYSTALAALAIECVR